MGYAALRYQHTRIAYHLHVTWQASLATNRLNGGHIVAKATGIAVTVRFRARRETGKQAYRV